MFSEISDQLGNKVTLGRVHSDGEFVQKTNLFGWFILAIAGYSQ